MKPNLEDLDLVSMLDRVDPNGFSSRPPVGVAFFVARGEIWLTQDGLREDLILRATAARLRDEELMRFAQALHRGWVQLRHWVRHSLSALQPRFALRGGRRGEHEWRRIEHLGPTDREASLLSAARLFH
jgi:hypothetical protein